MDHSHHSSHAFGLRPVLGWDCLHEEEVTSGEDALDEAPSPSLNVVIFHRKVKWIFALRETDGSHLKAAQKRNSLAVFPKKCSLT